MEKNELQSHNSAAIDKAAAMFVESATRAVTEEPHGSLTLRFEWRAFGAHRMVVTEEQSEMFLPARAD
jgi:hypothetical protein